MTKTAMYYDANLDHLRQRAEAAGLEIDDGLCAGCHASLTETDLDAGECTQCRTPIETIDNEGE